MNLKILAGPLLASTALLAQPAGAQEAPHSGDPIGKDAYLTGVSITENNDYQYTLKGLEEDKDTVYTVQTWLMHSLHPETRKDPEDMAKAVELLQEMIDKGGNPPVTVMVYENPEPDQSGQILSSRSVVSFVLPIETLAERASYDINAIDDKTFNDASFLVHLLETSTIEEIDWARENARIGNCEKLTDGAVSVTATLSGDSVTLLEQGGLGRTWTHTIVPFANKPDLTAGQVYTANPEWLDGMLIDTARDSSTGETVDASYMPLDVVNEDAPYCRDTKSTRIVAKLTPQ